MNPIPAVLSIRLSALALAAALASGCTLLGDGLLSGDKVDYRSSTVKTKPLDVPPDLTQLARDSRYQLAGGVISAAAAGATAAPGAAAAASAPATIAVAAQGPIRVERDGQQRWLVVPKSTPEQLWPQVRSFWEQSGFTLDVENAQVGVMETNWAENRAKLPNDMIRSTLGKLVSGLFDNGERDRFRTRVERTADGTEIYVSHRGIEEVYTDERHENLSWRARPNDPQLEAELLARLMLALGPKDELAPTATRVATASASVASAPEAAGRARVETTAGSAALVVDETFDRTWRRVGLALDRSGFTVEDRDRAAGLYYVRYVDPKSVGKEEPGWWARLFSDAKNPGAPQRYRIAVKAAADNTKTNVSVQTTAGAPESGENAQRIVARLVNDLK